ncbi:unnamed protein product [Mytilus edulis]|uniref:Integrase core domain-containing protein n=1 Tax=Mytilus edulis TaxID=6550 RepID=A0A8S3UXB9_MYTED|nr:unnamed protein product [Mytilus edulis]
MQERDQLIFVYFHLGLNNKEILQILNEKHRIGISLCHLKRLLASFGLYRRKNYSDLLDVVMFIHEQVQESGQLNGYRWMHLKCLHSGLTVRKETVRLLMRALNPGGVNNRLKRKLKRREYNGQGPNFIWHLDSYDKLKPFGFCINGCIDGYSRFIVWLHVNRTSSDPRVIAGYYIKAVIRNNGVPLRMRGDLGTENTHTAQMQTFFHRNDHRNTFIYGTSQHNQRIESWWSVLRRENTDFWISLFQTFKKDGFYTGDFIDKNLLQFCFMKLLKREFQIDTWNHHKIRPCKYEGNVHGRPVILYNCPRNEDTLNFLCPVRPEDVEACLEECLFPEDICDKNVFDLACIVMRENHLDKPEDPYAATNLYIELRNIFRIIMEP